MFEWIQTITWAVQAASDSSSDNSFTKLAFVTLLSGFVFYGAIFMRYRNTDKRHDYESETEATMNNVRAVDNLAGRVTGVRNSHIPGAANASIASAIRKLL